MSQSRPFVGAPLRGMVHKYGINFPKGVTALDVELYCFQAKMAKRVDPELGGVRARDHFKNVALMLWPEENKNGPYFKWHPAAERMLDACCENKYLAIAGASGFGKSQYFSIWAIINFISAPRNTLIPVTSVSLEGARGRIWGQIEKFWTPLEKRGFPGKLVSSRGMIVYVERNAGQEEKTQGNLAGIMLIAADKKKNASEATGKIQGLHQDTVIFIADELSEISDSVPEAAWSNLASGTRVRFQFVGISNPVSFTDAFGKFAKPKAGWTTINVDTGEWETALGKAIHFDDIKNPNVLAGRKIYDWMRTQEDFDSVPEEKRNSSQFWKMYRGFWCPVATDNTIYSDVEIASTKSDTPAIWLGNDAIWLSGLDPAFTPGGDRCVAAFAKLGIGASGLRVLEFQKYVIIYDEVDNQDETISEQIIRKWRDACEKLNIPPRNCAYDRTGVGIAFGHMVSMLWSRDVLGIDFGGRASDLAVSAYDSTKGHERYYNRVSEIWHGIKEYMQTGQIRGVMPDLQRELTARKFMEERHGGNKIRIESKAEMKMRTGESPDIADACLLIPELARQRFGFLSKKVGTDKQPLPQNKRNHRNIFHDLDSIYRS